jgi:hypothetical protein
MATVGILLDFPAIPRILELLKEKAGGRDEADLAASFPEGTYSRKALDILLARGIVTREEGLLKLAETEESNRAVAGVMRFYGQVDRVARRRLLFRGILNGMQYQCLVHLDTFYDMMQAEGYDRPDVDAMIARESKEGYVEQVNILYRGREGLMHRSFPFIPLYYYPHFIMMKAGNTEHLRERLKNAGVLMVEESYLLGHYPKELARQSREYIIKEKSHIQERMKNEAFDVWWYYRF